MVCRLPAVEFAALPHQTGQHGGVYRPQHGGVSVARQTVSDTHNTVVSVARRMVSDTHNTAASVAHNTTVRHPQHGGVCRQ
ncbi:MAG: hypothetical protein LBJ41_09680 [Treponema sp.]|nr:hypothetical protein [Treponema sp.]